MFRGVRQDLLNHYLERSQVLGLSSLEYRRLRFDVIEVFKIINKIDVVNTEKIFNFAQYVRVNVFSNSAANVWNSLPESVDIAPSLNTLNRKLNKYWHGHYLKFNSSCYSTGQLTISKWVNRNCW